MLDKYGGNINNLTLKKYFQNLINRIYKILPMAEENSETLDEYVCNLMKELCGGEKLLLDSDIFIELINNLETFTLPYNLNMIKSQVFHCINLCEKIIKRLEDDEIEL